MPAPLKFLLLLAAVLVGVFLWQWLEAPSHESGTIGGGPGDGEGTPIRDPRLHGPPSAQDPTVDGAPADPVDGQTECGSVTVRTLRYGTAGKMPGVLVAAVDAAGRRHEGRSDADGEITFAALALGMAHFELVAPGWVAESQEDVEVTAEPSTVFLALQRATRVTGRVVSATDDAPVFGARVIAAASLRVGHEGTRKGGDVWNVVETDSEGAFLLKAVPLGDDVTVTVLARGFAREVREVVIHEAEAAAPELLFRLQAGGAIRGQVVDRSGRRIEGARVFVFPDGDEHLRQYPGGAWSDGVRTVAALRTVTSADGRFVVGGLALDGRYAATAFAAQYVRSEDVNGLVPTANAAEVAVALIVRTPAVLELVIRDEERRTVSGAKAVVGWYPYGMRGNDAEGKTDADGRVRLAGLLPGTHALRIEADDFLPFADEFELREGETRQIDARLLRGVTISGIVVDDAGVPLADVNVEVKPEDGERWPRPAFRTVNDGRFAFGGLEAAPHAIQAYGTGFTFDRVEGVIAPADDVRLVGVRPGVVSGRLVLPPGTPTPERILVGSYDVSGGGGGSHQPWPTDPIEWSLRDEERILRIEGEGFAPWELRVRIEPGGRRDLGEIRLPPGVDLAGRVVDREGEPVAGALVEATDHSFRTTSTDSEGRFVLRSLRPGGQEIEIRARGFLVRAFEPNRDTSRLDMRVVLECGVALRVRVLDAEERPVAGVEVSVVRTDETEAETTEQFENWRAWDETDAQGRMRARLAPGIYRIEVGDEEDPLADAAVTLREGEAKEVALRVP